MKLNTSPLLHWLALWFCDPQVAGSSPVGDGQGYELFGEIVSENQRFFFFFVCFCVTHQRSTIYNASSPCSNGMVHPT